MRQAVPRHPLIADYLERLSVAAEPLGLRRACELVDDIREHLTEALPGPDPETADVRRVLARLGEPHDVVAAAWDDAAPGEPVGPPTSRGRERWRYLTAIVLLVTAGLVAPLWPLAVPAWIAGLALFATVAGWTIRERRIGWFFLGLGFPMGLLFMIAGMMPFLMMSQMCTVQPDGTEQCTGTSGPDWAAAMVLAAFVLFFVGQVITVIRLVRAQRDPGRASAV